MHLLACRSHAAYQLAVRLPDLARLSTLLLAQRLLECALSSLHASLAPTVFSYLVRVLLASFAREVQRRAGQYSEAVCILRVHVQMRTVCCRGCVVFDFWMSEHTIDYEVGPALRYMYARVGQ